MNNQRPDSSELNPSEPEAAKNAILAQFHAAEYSAFMGRVSSWESLQYAAWPILIAALAFLFTVIALTVALLTLFFLSGFYQPAPEVPLQWIGLVVIVVAFYFKERFGR